MENFYTTHTQSARFSVQAFNVYYVHASSARGNARKRPGYLNSSLKLVYSDAIERCEVWGAVVQIKIPGVASSVCQFVNRCVNLLDTISFHVLSQMSRDKPHHQQQQYRQLLAEHEILLTQSKQLTENGR